MVVKPSEGRDAVRAYLSEHASRGLEHVRSLLAADNDHVLSLVGDLTEEEGMKVTPADEWRIFDALKHLAASSDRSKDRLEKLSTGQPFVNPPGAPGQMGSAEYASFDELRRAYIDGMSAVLGVLDQADPSAPTELTAEHGRFGPFNWLEWALYSHHVHTHDHIGQIENVRKALRGG